MHKDIAQILERMNTKYGHDAPLNGIVQYQLLISKTRTQDRLLNFHGLRLGDFSWLCWETCSVIIVSKSWKAQSWLSMN